MFKGVRPLLRGLLHGLRTEGSGPAREAAAIGVGVFVGCSPFYGFHLLICWALGTLFRLNRLKVYLAAHVSNPILAPFLLLAELQSGAWLRSGTLHELSLETLRTVDPWVFGRDLLVGAVVVGASLGGLAAALTYAAVRGGSRDVVFGALVQRASDRYAGESIVAWEFARGKLHGDPVYRTVLSGGLLPAGGTLMDVGCGQGLMLALLVEGQEAVRVSAWPKGTPPPRFDRLVGVELRPRVARLARIALEGSAEILEGDAGALTMDPCSAVLLFDVLQMMSGEKQEQLLVRISKGLSHGGVILVREADASAGWRFAIVRSVNRLKAIVSGAWRQKFHYRCREDWLACFGRCGLVAEVCPSHDGETLGNLLFRVTVPRP